MALQQVVDGATADGLTSALVKAFESDGGLDVAIVGNKLLSFGIDGVSTSQDAKKGVTKQLNNQYTYS